MRQDHGTARRANRIGAEAVVEPHPAFRQAIDVGRAVHAAAVRADGARSMIVSHHIKYVGTFAGISARGESRPVGNRGHTAG